ncbi:MAG: hypothetical protein AAF561_00040 [Planctomycetota bacterium]
MSGLQAPVVSDDDRMITAAQLADWWNTTTNALAMQRSRKVGPPFVRLGGSIRYRRGDVLEYMASRRVQTDAQAAA